jgi:DNA polymerase I-like protein with 3'-5' exonuclease and polymerase domains
MKSSDRDLAARALLVLLRIAKLQTMKEKYEQLEAGPDGRIRTVLSLVGKETGGMSSSGSFLERSTSLQNQPKRMALIDMLYDTRRCFVPDAGQVFIEAALVDGEAALVAEFANDDRIAGSPATLAINIFGRDASITDRHVYLAGAARDVFNYGAGWKGYADYVNANADLTGHAVSAAEAKRIHTAYHKRFPKLKSWWSAIREDLRRNGNVRNPFGRRRDLFGRNLDERVKQAATWLAQSTIADHINGCVADLFELERQQDFQVLLPQRSAILLQTPVGNWRRVVGLVKRVLEMPIGGVGLECEVRMSSKNWSEMGVVA